MHVLNKHMITQQTQTPRQTLHKNRANDERKAGSLLWTRPEHTHPLKLDTFCKKGRLLPECPHITVTTDLQHAVILTENVH